MNKTHQYPAHLVWTGNRGEGTATYRSYDRSYTITIKNKPELLGSADPLFRGDVTRYNPEELLVASLSACHLLSYLHLCANNGIVLTHYEDEALGTMAEDPVRGGYFTEVVLNISIVITDLSKKQLAEELHAKAHELCFIANSVNFPVRHVVEVRG